MKLPDRMRPKPSAKPTPKVPTRPELAQEWATLSRGHAQNVANLHKRLEANRKAREEVVKPFDATEADIQAKLRDAGSVSARLERLEDSLRRTAEPCLVDALAWFGAVEGHLRQHFGIYVAREEETLKDMERAGTHEASQDGPLLETLRREKRVRDLSSPTRAAVAQGIELVRTMQLEAEPDPAALQKITDSIPLTCPCGIPLPEKIS
ncbi:MAG: hypothetical protein Q8N53_16860 [Longimicrobiales bacterium]|nr:hypothetical protein [Longimicrobiales bacterium]